MASSAGEVGSGILPGDGIFARNVVPPDAKVTSVFRRSMIGLGVPRGAINPVELEKVNPALPASARDGIAGNNGARFCRIDT